MDSESGGELEVGRDAVKARINIDAGLVQGGMEIDIEVCWQRRREAVASELPSVIVQRTR